MNLLHIDGLIYKQGLNNKCFYQAHDGEWLLSNIQKKINKEFYLQENQIKQDKKSKSSKLTKAGETRQIILNGMKGSALRTRLEFAVLLDIDPTLAKHRFMDLVKTGQIVVAGIARCSIINRKVKVYKLA